MFFHIPTPQVVHETIEGETVIVNLLNGHYYTLRGTGAVTWQLIAGGASHQQVSDCLLAWYSGEAGSIQAGLDAFIQALQAEGLLIPAVNAEQVFDPQALTPPPGRPAFQAPEASLEVFSDMQNILLLDPVHEVSEQGWPHPAPGDKAAGAPNA